MAIDTNTTQSMSDRTNDLIRQGHAPSVAAQKAYSEKKLQPEKKAKTPPMTKKNEPSAKSAVLKKYPGIRLAR